MSSEGTGLKTRLRFQQLVLNLAWNCNYRCDDCFLGNKRLGDTKNVMTVDEAKQIIDSAAELKSINSIAFVGGEPFLSYEKLLIVSDYISNKYNCMISITTNCYWATTITKTKKLLEPLQKRGLVEILLSLDDFHLHYGALLQTANCLSVCRELKIHCIIQSIITKTSRKIKDFQEELKKFCDEHNFLINWKNIEWINYPVVPIGRASQHVAKNDLIKYKLSPGNCSIQKILNISPEGDVKPCCGPGLIAESLKIGNIKKEKFIDIISRTETNPLINSIITWQGPLGLAKILAEHGMNEYVEQEWAGPCDACHHILSNSKAIGILQKILKDKSLEILTARIASENNVTGQMKESIESSEDLERKVIKSLNSQKNNNLRIIQ